MIIELPVSLLNPMPTRSAPHSQCGFPDARFFLCQCWLMVCVTFASQARFLAISMTSAVEKKARPLRCLCRPARQARLAKGREILIILPSKHCSPGLKWKTEQRKQV